MTLIGGMGKAFDVGSHELDVAVRYAHGIIQTNDNKLSLGWKTRELSATVGFRF